MNPKTSKALADFVNLLKVGYDDIPPHNDPSLLDRWSIAMETQVNVNASLGNPTDIKGVYEWRENPEVRFWPLRIPKHANTDKPEFKDKPLAWPLVLFSAGIGCTGWDWQARASKWVGFDFDAISGHADGVGVSAEQLQAVKDAACALPWVEVRRSTGGKGLHLYVLLEDIPTATHTEHAALARCILGMMSSETGFDFASRIDACGGNMWIWHRKSTPENRGLELIKAGSKLGMIDLPTNWRDHVDVVRRKRTKVGVAGIDNEDKFDKLANSQTGSALDDAHRAVLDALRGMPYACEWVSDHNCARIHTKALEEIPHQGVYQTNSQGRDPNTPNGFMFPLPDGGWAVYRFSPGITEAPTWEQDGEGWTTCQFNVPADLRTVSMATGAVLTDNGFLFAKAESAVKALELLGTKKPPISDRLMDRKTTLRIDRNGHVAMSVAKDKTDDEKSAEFDSWKKARSEWTFTTRTQQRAQTPTYSIDNQIKLAKTQKDMDAGWLIQTVDGSWNWTSRENAKVSLLDHDYCQKELDHLLAKAIRNPWKLVQLPFQPLYPGGRQINWGAPQYRFQPADVDDPVHPHWDMILSHCFQDLDNVLPGNEWAQRNSILTGRDFGLLWIACLLRNPFAPLPYLFLFGEQNSGKSILPESIRDVLILNDLGVVHADRAVKRGDFNGELENAVLAYIDETDLSCTKTQVYEKIKSWVTSKKISIRKMRTDSFDAVNTLHFIQCANDRRFCPVQFDDTRIMVLEVPKPAKEIARKVLDELLETEAPHFMRSIMNATLPTPEGRLHLPVIDTPQRGEAIEGASPTTTLVGQWVAACCIRNADAKAKGIDLYEAFDKWANGNPELLTLAEKINPTQFYTDLEKWKFRKIRPAGTVHFRGLEVRS